MSRGIYLDNSTATRPSSHVVSKMMPFYNDLWGAPTSPNYPGNELLPSMAEAYRSIYTLLGAKEIDTFVFTSSGAEAVNQAIFSAYFEVTLKTGKNQFLTSLADEAPAIMTLSRLEAMDCVCQQIRPNKEGIITAESLSKMITPRTALVSLSWGNGLTGTFHSLDEIANLCRQRGILLHLDISHVLGKLYFETSEIDAHYFTFSGDQLHAPRGCGGLLIKAGTPCKPLILGGNEQNFLRAGSFSTAHLAGLGLAAKEAIDSRDLLCTEVARLRDKLEMGIVAHYPEAVPFYCHQERLPHCTTIAFPSIVNEALLYALNRKGVFACIGGGNFQQLSQILTFSEVPETLAQTAISFSLSRETTEIEIELAIEKITTTAKHLRKNWNI